MPKIVTPEGFALMMDLINRSFAGTDPGLQVLPKAIIRAFLIGSDLTLANRRSSLGLAPGQPASM